MNLAVITRADANIKAMSELTHPHLKAYAKRCGADFIVLDHESPVDIHDGNPHYRILKVKEILEDYDRVLLIDTDTLVLPACPNIFDTVPATMIGSIFEDKGSRAESRRDKMRRMQQTWGDVGWTRGYTNAGVFVLSKEHGGIFDPHEGQYWRGWGSADLHMGYMAHKLGYKVSELPYQWNHMTPHSEAWNGSPDRFNSFIIHYAGKGVFDPSVSTRLEQIRQDIEAVRGAV